MLKKAVAGLLAGALTFGVLAGCIKREPDGTDNLPAVVARIDGQDVPAADLVAIRRVFALYFKEPMDGPEAHYELLKHLVNQRLMAGEARSRGITVTPEERDEELERFLAEVKGEYGSGEAVEARMKELRLSLEQLQTYVEEFLLARKAADAYQDQITLTEEEIKQYYDENRTLDYTFAEDVVRAAHILLPSNQEEKARELAGRARAGEDFGALAGQYSTDVESALVGGDLGYFTKSDMVSEFTEAAFALKPGEISDPVKSMFGWHIIKVVDKRPAGVIPFEEAKSDIINKLLPGKKAESLQTFMDQLQEKHGVELLLTEPTSGSDVTGDQDADAPETPQPPEAGE